MSKKYKNLFEQIVDIDNIRLAYKKAVAGGNAAHASKDLDALVSRCKAEFGSLNVLVNNAAIAPLASIEEMTPELARMESLDMGKPLTQSTGEIPATADTFRYFAGLADKIEGEVLVTPHETFGYTVREPFGVVASITPWNFPILILSIKGAPVITCTTPGGKPTSWASRPTSRAVDGDEDAGLKMMQLPAARAGPPLMPHMQIGKFHGMIAATTPWGSRRV